MSETNHAPEEWRAIPGYEGHYEVSDQGRVRSHGPRSLPYVLTPYTGPTGYLRFSLFHEGHRKDPKVHQLVALAFIGSRPDGLEVRHLDGDRQNNTPSNLVYGTKAENARDTSRHGTYVNSNSRKTHCPQGHPYDEVNTRHLPGGGRKCRECHRLEAAARRKVARLLRQ